MYGEDIRADFKETIAGEYERVGTRGCAAAVVAAYVDVLTSGLGERAQAIGRDLLFALRSLRKTPFFAAVVIATWAIAIAANTAVFSVVNGVLFKPLPFPDASSLVAVEARSPDDGADVFSYPNYADLRAQNEAFAAIGAATFDSASLTGQGSARVLMGARVSPSYFEVFGVRAEIGRLVTESDSRPGAAGVVLISDRLYRSGFAADPTIIGRSIVLDGEAHRVIGVASPGLRVPADNALKSVDYFTTIGPKRSTSDRGSSFLSVYARLRQGRSLGSANVDAGRIMANLAVRYPSTNRGVGVAVVPLAEKIVGSVRQLLVTINAAVGAVLLIACANVANLIFSRAAARERELAIRFAIGATRPRIIAQIMTETLLLAAIGGAAGMLLAVAALDEVVAWQPNGIPRLTDITFDASAALFAVALAGICTIVAGLAPAVFFSRAPFEFALKAAGRGSGRSHGARARATFVVAEIAITLALVVASGLVLRSYTILISGPLGFEATGVTAIDISTLPARSYASATRRIAFARRAVSQAATLPGVTGAAYCAAVPFLNSWQSSITFPGRRQRPGRPPSVDVNVVSQGYFGVMRIPLVRGRLFNDTDRVGATPVAMVNMAFARRYFGSASPMASLISVDVVNDGDDETEATIRTIVGIAADTRTSYTGTPRPQIYLASQQIAHRDSGTILIRSDAPVDEAATAAAIARVDPDVAIANIAPLTHFVTAATERARLTAIVLGTLAGVALFLAGTGIYAVVSYGVAQRTHEFGVRRALGARAVDVVRDILVRATRLAVFGISGGIILAAFATRFLADQLYGIGPADPLTYGAVIIAIFATTLIAALIPAVRAIRVDPIVAIRYE